MNEKREEEKNNETEREQDGQAVKKAIATLSSRNTLLKEHTKKKTIHSPNMNIK